jgi:hypothetical protein
VSLHHICCCHEAPISAEPARAQFAVGARTTIGPRQPFVTLIAAPDPAVPITAHRQRRIGRWHSGASRANSVGAVAESDSSAPGPPPTIAAGFC